MACLAPLRLRVVLLRGACERTEQKHRPNDQEAVRERAPHGAVAEGAHGVGACGGSERHERELVGRVLLRVEGEVEHAAEPREQAFVDRIEDVCSASL